MPWIVDLTVQKGCSCGELLLDSPILFRVPWENNGIQLTKKRIWTDFMIYDGIQILHIIRYMFEDRIPGAWINVSSHIIRIYIYTYHSISNCTMMYWWACTIQWICTVHLTYIYIHVVIVWKRTTTRALWKKNRAFILFCSSPGLGHIVHKPLKWALSARTFFVGPFFFLVQIHSNPFLVG